jgi:hypothetical protein
MLPAPRSSPASLHPRASYVVILSGRGLQFLRELPYEMWCSVGRQLSGIHTTSAWCLGDWLVYGEIAYERRYRGAIELTSLDYQTLRNYAWVARRFKLSRRREALSFGHHAEVAALPEAEQDFWLRKAEELSWPVKRLRHEVRESLAERKVTGRREDSEAEGRNQGASCESQPSPQDPAQCIVEMQIHPTPLQIEAWQTAANRADLDVRQWAMQALDRAARDSVDSETVLDRELVSRSAGAGRAGRVAVRADQDGAGDRPGGGDHRAPELRHARRGRA